MIKRIVPLLLAGLLAFAPSVEAGKATVVRDTINWGSGTQQTYTSSGFGTPDAVLILIGWPSANDTDTDCAGFTWAIYDGTNIYSISAWDDDDVATTDGNTRYSNSELQWFDSCAGSGREATVTFSGVTDGVGITVTDTATSRTVPIAVTLFGGGLNAAVVTAGLTGSPVSFAPGFVADFFIGMMHRAAASTPNQVDLFVQVGAAVNDTGPPQAVVGYRSDDNLATADINKIGARQDISFDHNDATDYYSVSSFTAGAGSNEIQFTETSSQAYREYGMLAIGGVNDKHLELVSLPASTGVSTYTAGFQADFLYGAFINHNTWDDGDAATDGNVSIGVYDGTTEHSFSVYSEDAPSGNSNTGSRSSTKFQQAYQSSVDASEWTGAIDSITATEFKIDWTQTSSGRKGFVLAVKWNEDAAAKRMFISDASDVMQ